MNARPRLFVAVELPDDARAAIVRAVDAMAPPAALRRTAADQLHLTLLFLGGVEPDRIPSVGERLDEVVSRAAPLDTALTVFGTFPPQGAVRVLWVGLRDDDGALAALADATKDTLRDLVITDERPFRAHVTVARAREKSRLSSDALETVVEPVRFEVRGLTLFRSHLGGGAPARYEPLQRWHLGPPRP
jgi:RNA 2',3'-cyclic 3'-phosphodiesterase